MKTVYKHSSKSFSYGCNFLRHICLGVELLGQVAPLLFFGEGPTKLLPCDHPILSSHQQDKKSPIFLHTCYCLFFDENYANQHEVSSHFIKKSLITMIYHTLLITVSILFCQHLSKRSKKNLCFPCMEKKTKAPRGQDKIEAQLEYKCHCPLHAVSSCHCTTVSEPGLSHKADTQWEHWVGVLEVLVKGGLHWPEA